MALLQYLSYALLSCYKAFISYLTMFSSVGTFQLAEVVPIEVFITDHSLCLYVYVLWCYIDAMLRSGRTLADIYNTKCCKTFEL